MAKQRPKPRTVVLPNGDRFHLVVMRVISRKEDGTPYEMIMMQDEDNVELCADDPHKNCFITAFVAEADYSEFAGQIPAV